LVAVVAGFIKQTEGLSIYYEYSPLVAPKLEKRKRNDKFYSLTTRMRPLRKFSNGWQNNGSERILYGCVKWIRLVLRK
jgi:hypothetical protein